MCVCVCVKWESTNTGWHIDVHHVKTLCTYIKGDMRMGHSWVKWMGLLWAFMGEMGRAVLVK